MSAQQAAARRPTETGPDVAALMAGMGRAARAASRHLARAASAVKNEALTVAAASLRARVADLVAANEADVAAAQANGVEKAFLDRLRLDPNAVEGVARGLEAIVALPDPVGRRLARYERPNGLVIDRVATPLGVIGVIYESRPGVTADAGALCLKAGNAVILRGGADSFRSAGIIHECLSAGLAAAGLPAAAIQRVPVTDRAAVGAMLAGLDGDLDVIVPRGGKSLVARVQAEARVPVFAHLEGINHIYVHRAADLPMAKAILKNSKLRSTSVCGAAETLLVDRDGAATLLKPLVGLLLDSGCTVRGDAATLAVDPRVEPATADDWGREFLDAVMAVKVVDGLDAAVAHIEAHGSQHTDCIVTADPAAADRFLSEVDSAIVLHNASTQFADGGEFGFGGEIGIATGRMHARGPVGLEQLTTFNYRVRGSGQIRS